MTKWRKKKEKYVIAPSWMESMETIADMDKPSAKMFVGNFRKTAGTQ